MALRGPNGEFVMEDPSARDLAFLAAGTGVAPLKSMIEETFEAGGDTHEGTTRDLWLFLGCSWRDDLPYLEEFRSLAAEQENFHFVPTVTREAYLSEWSGEDVYVQHAFPKYLGREVDIEGELAERLEEAPETTIDARIDPTNLEVYACGVSAMVETLTDVASTVGVPSEHIHGEGYG